MIKLRVVGCLLAGVSGWSVSSAALAQDATQPSSSEAQKAQDSGPVAPAPAQQTASDIVVTGSRTIRNGNNSPTPVTVIAKDTLQDVRPTSLTESLNIMPVFSGSRGSTTNPGATGGVSSGNGNAAQLNLRNVGTTRTLVLMDGRRVPPTSFTNIVDADIVPQLLIERVDVVTGGVSAVYGSDAVSGVVNFVTNKNFNGLRAQGQMGISKYGDDASQEAGIAAGTKLFGGRGHIEASYEFRNDEGLLRRSDRSWFTRPTVVGSVAGSTAGAGTTGNPWTLIEDTTLANFPFGGRIINCGTGCGVTGQYFAANGTLSPFGNGAATGSSGVQVGGAGGYFDNSLKSSMRMHQLYGRFDYDVSDSIKAFVVAGANFKRNVFYGNDLQLNNFVLTKANPYLGSASSLITGNTVNGVPGTFTFSKIFNQAPRAGGIPRTSQYLFTGGLDGKLGGGWDWNLAYTHGYAKLHTTLLNNVNNQRLAAATDVIAGPNGPVCYASTVNSAYADCVPLNLFGPTSANAAAIDYIMDDTDYSAITKQDDVTGDISGSPFSTWAGPVTVALSGEWRKQSFSSSSDATPSMYADCTSLRLDCNSTGSKTFLWLNTIPGSPKVSQSVWETAAEANVPLLKDVTLVKSFEVNGALRYTRYNTVGSYWTWKIGADWHVTDDLRFRGTASRDIRAPTLNDLFAPTSVVIVNNPDLKPGSPAPNPGLIPSVNLANPDLTAEIGKTWTVGTIYRPHFVPGLSFAVDYYNIQIQNAITTVQGFQPVIQQGCYNSNIALYCDLIIRDSTGKVVEWDVKPVNLAVVKTYGVDFEANYAGHLFGRALNLRLLSAWQPHIEYVQPGTATLDQGGVAFGPMGLIASPKWRITGIASYKVTSNFRVDILERWRNKLKISGNPTDVFAEGQGTMSAHGETSLNLAYDINGVGKRNAELFLNIQNLFNAKPPLGNATGTGNGPGGFGGWAIGDDVVGRYFTAGIRFRM